MNYALLMLPDFGLIMLGALLARRLGFNRGFWDGAERLVYYALFPPLLFTAIANARFSLASEGRMLVAAVGAFLAAVALGFAARWVLRPQPAFFASCVQTAFRYNSYVGLALAQSLAGSTGVALLALILAFCVPLANVFAVYALARHRQTGVLREMAINPLILSTVSGLAANLLGLELPPLLNTFLTRLGSASLALGLLCIGAGLTFASVHEERPTMAWLVAVKLGAKPAIALLLIHALGLTGVPALIVLLFAALPTASSAYILAARMGGHATPVAYAITVQTLLAMLTLPLWISLAPR
ncbi:MAG TPA: AEC family transporter [Burkholderiaceae bacterium]|nr:AEC family transporter [Burkholderiaceae bacterium]HQR69040.1 AEC family transporter [Burkholderiaceae bacterium]